MTTRGKNVSRIARVALAAAALALTTGACAFLGDDEPAATPTPEATPTPTLEPTPPPTPEPEWPSIGNARILTDDLNVRVGPGREYAVLGRLATGDEVPVAGRATGGPWVAMPGIGWVFFDESWVELPAGFGDLPIVESPTSAWEISAPLHPPGTSTGLPVIDEVANAITDGSHSRLLALAVAEEPPVVPRANAGPCPEGLLPATELEAHLDSLLVSTVVDGETRLRPYAVIRGPAVEDRDPDFVAVFGFEGGEGRQIWISPDGAIQRFSLGCGDEPVLPGELLRLDATEPFFWFRPPLPQPLRPVQ